MSFPNIYAGVDGVSDGLEKILREQKEFFGLTQACVDAIVEKHKTVFGLLKHQQFREKPVRDMAHHELRLFLLAMNERYPLLVCTHMRAVMSHSSAWFTRPLCHYYIVIRCTFQAYMCSSVRFILSPRCRVNTVLPLRLSEFAVFRISFLLLHLLHFISICSTSISDLVF